MIFKKWSSFLVQYVGRLAPSPTGPIHLGIARTSLLAWLDARARGGRLILRIEDVDRTRCRPEAIPRLLQDLAWLGLDWDAGPDRPGPEGPYTQSERDRMYEDAIDRLTHMHRVYPCTCSRKEIARAASAPHGPSDEGPRYPGTCRAGAIPKPDRGPALRLRTEPGDVIVHRDRRLGEIGHDVFGVVGDFVLQRSDGHWAYQLAVAVDDALQGVTTVVRGEDLAGSTARQVLMRRLLYPERPSIETLHVPLLTDPGGTRMAKRTGGYTVAALRSAGIEPTRVVGRLAASVGLQPPADTARPEDLLQAWVNADFGARLVDTGPPSDLLDHG